MHFEQRTTVAAPRERVWTFVQDLGRVARCVPGVQDVEDLGDGRYRGVLKVSLGPVRLALRGDVATGARDEGTGSIALTVSAADRDAGGAVDAQVRLTVLAAGEGATTLDIDTEARVLGRIAEFGQPIIKRKADQLLTEFASNLAREVGA